ncbi:fusA, partial [Symbiodinium necroappetens]
IIKNKLVRDMKVDVEVGTPRVSYREAITKEATDIRGKFVKQTGGRGQFGDVTINIEPYTAAQAEEAELNFKDGVAFENKIVGGKIPREYIPSVEVGIRQTAASGIMAGFPLIGFKATLVDGSYHPVDSSQVAFEQAARLALSEACNKAGLTLLEPIMKVVITTPDEYIGSVTGDISSRRGLVMGTEERGNARLITAEVPLSEMFGYTTVLRSMSQGRATSSMEPLEYRPLPPNMVKEVVAASNDVVKLTKIYTKVGDGGETMLGSGEMVEKSSPRVTAYGEVDEANASIGLAVAILGESDLADREAIAGELTRIQNDLFDVGADLCVPVEADEEPGSRLRTTEAMVTRLEEAIDRWNARLAPLNSFILPGGSKASAAIHVSRTVTRRAERAVAALCAEEPESTMRYAQIYLNRLSDYLFVIARVANGDGERDVLWTPGGQDQPLEALVTATVTSDFREEFEAESTRRLRKRFMWYCGVVLGLSLINAISVVILFIFIPQDHLLDAWVITIATVIAVIPFVWAFLFAKKRQRIARQTLIRIVFWLIVGTSIINLAVAPFSRRASQAIAIDQAQKIQERRANAGEEAEPAAAVDAVLDEIAEAVDPEADVTGGEGEPEATPEFAPGTQQDAATEATLADDAEPATNGGRVVVAQQDLPGGGTAQVTVDGPRFGIGAMWMLNLLITHVFASLFIPWTPREAIAPLVPLLILNALLLLGFKTFGDISDRWIDLVLIILLSPLVGVPGTLICWWRHSRYRQKFHYKMLRGRYGEIKAEFSEARKIHEALFPAPIDAGPLRMDYIYEPMRQIGGDFLFSRSIQREDGSVVLHAVLVDVTGHGLTAALTVNRIAGEIEREFGEDPDTTPAQILTGLNNYIHHTLALHSVYATALAVRVDSREERVTWASAGHPPAFLRGVDGTIERLESTALVLGACLGDDFVVEELSHRFTIGDALLVYTDGATEARNDEGVMIGVRGLEAIMANGRPEEFGGWSATVMRHVEQHRYGQAEDDTLLVEIYRPVTVSK